MYALTVTPIGRPSSPGMPRGHPLVVLGARARVAPPASFWAPTVLLDAVGGPAAEGPQI